jgi:Uncharacterized protein conserved in bacteria (DUF2171)
MADVQVGMDVVGADKEHVRKVKEVYDNEFLVDRPLQTDLYVPRGAIRQVTTTKVILSIPSYAVNWQGWPIPQQQARLSRSASEPEPNPFDDDHRGWGTSLLSVAMVRTRQLIHI